METMIRLAQKYPDQQDAWPKLFQRILQNLIRDWHRRKKVRSILVWWDQYDGESPEQEDKLGDNSCSPENLGEQRQVNEQVLSALKYLPIRQQQAFLLRAWWQYDTEATAFAMGCSCGSVKTHYSWAVKKLKQQLGEVLL